MARKKTPPEYGESLGPIIVACQWNRSSPIGPAEQDEGGSTRLLVHVPSSVRREVAAKYTFSKVSQFFVNSKRQENEI